MAWDGTYFLGLKTAKNRAAPELLLQKIPTRFITPIPWPGFHTNTNPSESRSYRAHIASIIAPRSRALHSAMSRERQIVSIESNTARPAAIAQHQHPLLLRIVRAIDY